MTRKVGAPGAGSQGRRPLRPLSPRLRFLSSGPAPAPAREPAGRRRAAQVQAPRLPLSAAAAGPARGRRPPPFSPPEPGGGKAQASEGAPRAEHREERAPGRLPRLGHVFCPRRRVCLPPGGREVREPISQVRTGPLLTPRFLPGADRSTGQAAGYPDGLGDAHRRGLGRPVTAGPGNAGHGPRARGGGWAPAGRPVPSRCPPGRSAQWVRPPRAARPPRSHATPAGPRPPPDRRSGSRLGGTRQAAGP